MFSKFSVKKPYTVWVGVVLVLVLGVVSLMRMTTDLLPNMSLPYALVITTDPGASPEEIEKSITAPIEAAMATTSNIKSVSSVSSNSYSMVILEYEQDTNMDSVVIEMQQKLDQLKGGWADTVSAPMIMQLDPNMLPIMVASADIEGMSQIEIAEYVENELKPSLESVEGVATVSLTGTVEERYTVIINEDKVNALNEKILAEIDEKFVEAREELADAREEVESGQKELENAQKELASQMASNTNDVVNGKIEASIGGNTLTQTINELNANKAPLEKAIKELKALNENALMTEKLISVGPAILTELSSGNITEEEAKQQLQNEGIVLPESEYPFAMTLGGAIATAPDILNQINAGLQTEEAQKAYATMGLTVNSYQDLPVAIEQLTKALAQLNAGIATAQNAQNQVNGGKVTLNDAYMALTEAEINAVIEMSTASSQLSSALAQIEAGEQQIDDAEESAKDSADLTQILTVDMINNLFMAQNFYMPAGYVMDGDTQYMVSVGDEVSSYSDLSNLVLMDMGMDSVGVIYLKDIADIKLVNDAADSYSRVNGNPAIMLSFEKQTGYSTGEVTDNLLARFESLEETNPELNIAVLMDQGVYIDMIVKSVMENMIVGAILAVIILIIFLKDWRSTFVIACSIPMSVVFAIVLMYFTDITLNLISLSGLALGIGMLVDNSIVVIENIYRLKKLGMSAKKAAVEGASQVGGAIIASTLTTICVFAPIIFTDGITKQLFVDIALTITYTLVASLIVALTFVPMMASGMLKNAVEPNTKLYDKIRDWYGNILYYILRLKPLVLILSVVLLIVSTWAAFSRGFTFMDMEMEADQISMTVGPNEDQVLTFEELKELADDTTEAISDIEGIETIGAMAGGGGTMSLMATGTDSVTYYILLDPESDRSMYDIIDEIEEKTKDIDGLVEISSSSSDMTAMLGSGLSIQVQGRDLDKLEEIAQDVAKIVEETEGTIDVNDGLEDTTASLTIHVDKEKAANYKMTVAQVFQLVYMEMAADTASTQVSTDVKDYDVYVMSEEQSEVTLNDIKKITFPYTNEDGEEEEIKITEIATFEEGISMNSINRSAQTRYINVTAGVDEDHNVTLVSNELQEKLDAYELPEGYSLKMAGEDEMIMDAMEQMALMLILAIIFIYMVMVAQFQSLLSPFIIMFTIPLAFTGGFGALYFSGYEVSVIAMVGFVMLAGIIVNNGIVMVDFINQLRREGMAKKEAIVEAGKARLRPILMTALTTILSMIPMVLGMGEGSEMMQPMAVTMAGGLIYGTLLTLIVVPCIYDIFNKNKSMVEEEL
ncbi:MAG: efflux RND transporter permease subunit [Lachnospiraceae bacterium]|nr:efflux RND transporter permease subunit [Lachnospiraceae bacterium]